MFEHTTIAHHAVVAVALALAVDAGILTGDKDFLGCGYPRWAVDALLPELRGE